MSYYYPQAAVELRILPEDFKLTSDASKQVPQRVMVIPKSVSVSVNDYKTTDTFNMELDYKNFPFDPRSIRSCGVVIYLQDMQSLVLADGSQNTLNPGASTSLNPSIPNAVFLGFVDEDHIEFNDMTQTVKLTGRDVTALLIDQKYQTNTPIALTQRLDLAIMNLLQAFAATQKIEVDASRITGGAASLPTLAQFYPDFGSPLAGHKNVGSKESYWEIIQDMVNRAGLICYMGIKISTDGKNLVPAIFLTTPKNQITTKEDDIKFVYGKNIKNLQLKRKLGRLKNFNLLVRSRVDKEVIFAKIPEEAEETWAKEFGISREPAKVPVLKPDGSLDTTTSQIAPYITFPVPNIADKQQLIKIAQTLYEQYSLQQLEGQFDTMEMLGRGTSRQPKEDPFGPFNKYDLVHIQKGQTISLEIDSDDLASISRLATVGERTQYLIRRNYDQTIASILASTMGKFSPRFQIKSYTMTLNQDQGFKLTVMFQNIINTENKGFSQ